MATLFQLEEALEEGEVVLVEVVVVAAVVAEAEMNG